MEVHWTYLQLDEGARAIAARLQRLNRTGQRALLLLPPGLEFASALLGCFYAGVVAVPTHLPRPNRSLDLLEAIVANASPTLALTTGELLPALAARFQDRPVLRGLSWLAMDEIAREEAEDWAAPDVGSDDLACLQYTSGSTATPKGVMLTHGNLIDNSAQIHTAFRHDASSVGVIWLPPYHDMGLIGGVLQPLYGGFPTVLLSPMHVIQRPLRWLRAISRYRATTSGGPNFIYDLCVNKIDADQCAALDLSSWDVAFSGAEPVRAETLARFVERFAPCGFREEAFFPCYGLAEATLLVSGGPRSVRPRIRSLDKDKLHGGKIVAAGDAAAGDAAAGDAAAGVVQVVSCGSVAPRQHVVTVHPESRIACQKDEIGEIWVSGTSVAQGYWNRSEETRETFAARLADGDGRTYLRTGDLGFLADGELFVTGRVKDLIIIDGRNHYPQDIEATVEQCHAACRPHCGAAFAVDADGERLVVVQEMQSNGRGANASEVLNAICRAVSEQHELAVHSVVLVKPGGVPKTTSGKIRRRCCRELFVNGGLDAIATYVADKPSDVARVAPADSAGTVPPDDVRSTDQPRGSVDARTVRQWLTARIARQLRCAPRDINVQRPFNSYGLTSRDAVELSGDLEVWLGRQLSASLVYEYPTVETVARYLSGEHAPGHGAADDPAQPPPAGEPIAIVGLGCRLPGAPNPDAFWRLLVEGRDAITEVPSDRWDADAVDSQVGYIGASQERGTVRWGGWLPDIDRFDATFFGISPREAACIDPQHRVLMEVAWEALEDAGLAVQQLRGSRTGVFVGISTNDYRRNVMSRASQLDPYWSTGNASCIAANRLSYFFDFKGPSIAVDTACSSSLVAVHWACRSLRAGECDLALAGGVNAILSPDISFSFVKGGGLARDGRCKAFDARADGIVRSEGAGLIVLKPLSRALRDGDAIYAIVRGCAVNQDGRSNGITAPNPAAQEAVIRTAWRDAGKSPAEATYVEAHGAGTPLGDVIEVKALGNALSDGRPPERRCAIGSVKTNVGHCEAAAGIASLIKVALAIKHGQLPPSLHFREPNPGIPFDAMPLFVQQTVAPWPASGGHRLSGVSSFGFGGTNAHVVLDAPPPATEPPRAPDARPESLQLLPLSAASPAALAAMAERFHQFLAGADAGCSAELAALCATASVRRSHLDHRAAIWTRSHQELLVQLAAIAKGEPRTDVVCGAVRPDHDSRVAFVFSGQGGQWPGMHQALSERFPAFREKINECDRLLRPLVDWSLLEQLQATQPDTDARGVNVETLQVCLFAFQVALAEAWRSWGIVPGAVVGHSMGEVAAACVAGALDLPDALRVMVHRSRLLQQALQEAADGGGMAAIRVSREEAEEFISGYEERLAIVVENSPRYTVLSGKLDTLQELLAFLRLKKISGRIMNVPGAAHSPQLEPTARKLARILQDVRPKPERVPFYSTLDGRQIRGTELDAAYWGNSVCRMVRFASAVDLLIDDGYRFFVEIGPHPMLTAAVTQCLQYRDKDAVVVASVRRDDLALDAMLQALGALYANGCDVPWKNVYPAAGRSRVPLPFYPWQRQRCWLDVEPVAAPPAVPTCRCSDGHADEHPLLGREIDLAVQPDLHFWNAPLSVARAPYLRQYQSGEVVVLPLATCLEAIVGAASSALGRHAHVIDQVEFTRALTFPPGAEETVQMVLETCGDEARFRCFSRQTGDSWKLHTSGRVRPLGSNGADVRFGTQMKFARDLQARLPETSRPDPNTADSLLQCVRRAWIGDDQALAHVALPESLASDARGYAVHPVLLDACFAAMPAAHQGELRAAGSQFLPIALDQIIWHAHPRPDATLCAYARIDPQPALGPDTVQGSLCVWEEEGRPILEARGLRFQRVAAPRTRDAERGTVPALSAADQALLAELLRALGEGANSQRESRLQEYLRTHVALALSLDPSHVSVHAPLMSLGIDSLMATEIRNRIEDELHITFDIAQVLESPTIMQLARTLLEKIDLSRLDPSLTPSEDTLPLDWDPRDMDPDQIRRLLSQIGEMPDDRVDDLMRHLNDEIPGDTS